MKKILLLLFAACMLFSCSSDNDKDSPTQKTGNISFKFNSNLSPSGASNLIGVQIYEIDNNKPYAYGLFDDINKIKINLPSKGKFTIKSSVVIDGKNKLSKDGSGYLKPFILNNGKGVALTNTFVITSTDYLQYLDNSTATLAVDNTLKYKAISNGKDYSVPPLDRWYGEAVNYDGDSDSDPIIDMQRKVFGIRFNVTFEGANVASDDCMYMAVDGAPDTLFVYAKDAVQSIEAMYTFSDFTSNQASIKLSVYHRLTTGEERKLTGSSGEKLYRNTIMILNQKCILDPDLDSYPYLWDGINDYYGVDSGF